MTATEKYDLLSSALSGIEQAQKALCLLRHTPMSDTEFDALWITTKQLDASWDRLVKRSRIAHRAMVKEHRQNVAG